MCPIEYLDADTDIYDYIYAGKDHLFHTKAEAMQAYFKAENERLIRNLRRLTKDYTHLLELIRGLR